MSVIFFLDMMITLVLKAYKYTYKWLIFEPTCLDMTVLSGERFLGKIPFGRFSPLNTETLYRNPLMLMRSEVAHKH